MTAPHQIARCLWCERAFEPRDASGGGSPQRFCGVTCRAAFHSATRKLGIELVERGIVTSAELRSGRALSPAGIFVAQQRTRCPDGTEGLTPPGRKAG